MGVRGIAAICMVILIIAMLPFFFMFEQRKPRPRDLVPIAVMSVIASLGRILFAAIPNFQPLSAIVIITGMQFGPQAGFLTGALSALASNMFLGQGPWTPWQMFAWGMMGLLAGMAQKKGFFSKRSLLYLFGFLAGILFGWFMNLQYLLGYVSHINLQAILLYYGASIAFDVAHGASTVIFLFCLEKSWGRKLGRLKVKYGILKEDSECT